MMQFRVFSVSRFLYQFWIFVDVIDTQKFFVDYLSIGSERYATTETVIAFCYNECIIIDYSTESMNFYTSGKRNTTLIWDFSQHSEFDTQEREFIKLLPRIHSTTHV